MKGFIRKLVVLLGSAGALAGAVGCNHPDLYDPCYPERYWHSSRQNVNAGFAQQVRNGHVLDQTVWNFHFCPGTDLLTPGGMEHLAYIARRRPVPDPCVYLETAKDLCYDPTCPEQFVKARAALDQCRIAAVQKFLTASSAGGNAPPFEVTVHNPPDISISGRAVDTGLRQLYSTPRATLPGQISTGGIGGGSGGAGGGGGSGGGG